MAINPFNRIELQPSIVPVDRQQPFVKRAAVVSTREEIVALYDRYVKLFGGTNRQGVAVIGENETKQDHIVQQFNQVLALLNNGKQYTFPIDVETVLAENRLVGAEESCANANEAYRFYVTELVRAMNQLHGSIEKAHPCLEALRHLLSEEPLDTHAANGLLSTLNGIDAMAQESLDALSRYNVVKDLTIQRCERYSYEGAPETRFVNVTNRYNCAEAAHVDFSKPYTSKIDETQINTLDDLRNLKTTKYTVDRIVTSIYYKTNEAGEAVLADIYEDNASLYIAQNDTEVPKAESPIAMLDELPLLDKLKYMILFYRKNGDAYALPGNRYAFPTSDGYPCVPNENLIENMKPEEDVNEWGDMEMFFSDYLFNRYGPLWALASAVSIKSNALTTNMEQVNFRLKALHAHQKLLNRGLDELNKSQANGNASIYNSAYAPLMFIGANVIRPFTKQMIEGGEQEFMALQFIDATGQTSTQRSARYLLVPNTDDGINKFVQLANVSGCEGPLLDHIFAKKQGVKVSCTSLVNLGIMTQNEWTQFIQNHPNAKQQQCYVGYGPAAGNGPLKKICLEVFVDIDGGITWQKAPIDCGIYILEDPNKQLITKELNVTHTNISAIVKENYGGDGHVWYKYKKGKDITWVALVKGWTSCFQTMDKNLTTSVQSHQKDVEGFSQKRNVIDMTQSNIINKIYTLHSTMIQNFIRE